MPILVTQRRHVNEQTRERIPMNTGHTRYFVSPVNVHFYISCSASLAPHSSVFISSVVK